MSRFYSRIIIILYILLLGGVQGCSLLEDAHSQKTTMMRAYVAGQNQVVNDFLSDKIASAKGSGDELMWCLEAGTHSFVTRNYVESIQSFAEAESLIEAYDDRAVLSLRDGAAEATATLTNQNMLSYRGWCRDRTTLSIYKSMAYLGANKEGSFRPQIRRLRDTQKEIINDYDLMSKMDGEASPMRLSSRQKTDFSKTQNAVNKAQKQSLTQTSEVSKSAYGNFLNPMGIFLSGISNIRDENYENAHIDFERLYACLPENKFVASCYRTLLEKTARPIPEKLKNVKALTYPLHKDCIYVVFANGRGVALKEMKIDFPIALAWPVCEYYNAPFQSLQVRTMQYVTQTERVANMDAIFSQEYEQRLPGIITRLIVSAIVKYGAAATATVLTYNEDEPLVGLIVLMASLVYIESMNVADTRTWETLPKEFQVAAIPMPANKTLTLSTQGGGKLSQKVIIPVNVKSAIIYVHAPSSNVFQTQILPMYSQ